VESLYAPKVRPFILTEIQQNISSWYTFRRKILKQTH
jgi:hypothetical protein